MSRNLERRLAQVERKLSELAKREKLAVCNCQKMTPLRTPEVFEAEGIFRVLATDSGIWAHSLF